MMTIKNFFIKKEATLTMWHYTRFTIQTQSNSIIRLKIIALFTEVAAVTIAWAVYELTATVMSMVLFVVMSPTMSVHFI